MVEDFLEQLSAAIPSTEGGVEDVLRRSTKTIKKLELRLADRRKLFNDGYACVQLVSFVHIYYLVATGLSVPARSFSRGEWVQALCPLVETAKIPL
jgi:hypothetical protein